MAQQSNTEPRGAEKTTDPRTPVRSLGVTVSNFVSAGEHFAAQIAMAL